MTPAVKERIAGLSHLTREQSHGAATIVKAIFVVAYGKLEFSERL